MSDRVAVIVGAGPGIGASLARLLGRRGWAVALMARDEERLTALGESLQAEDITAGWTHLDVTDTAEVTAAVTRFGGFGGRIDLLHHNAVAFRSGTATELTAEQLLADLAVGTASVLTSVQAALPFLREGSVVLATGSSSADSPMTGAASLGVQKAALRNLMSVLDADLRERGVRAASLTVQGVLAAGTPFDPQRIAERLADLALDTAEWQTEVSYDGS